MKARCRPSLRRSSRRRRKLTQSQLNRSRSPTKRKRTSRRCYDRHLVCATRLFCAKFLGRRAVYNLSISSEAFELLPEARILSLPFANAGVAELADALDSKSSDRKIVWVRAPPPAIPLKRVVTS